jgi:hypothetical protein
MTTSSRDRWLAINYAATIFVSAFLLFQIQPLITKHILPWFGGSPAVWTTCLLFFQTLLFAGYAYAHLLHSRFEPRRQAVVHGALLAAAVAMLVLLLPGESWQPQSYDHPVWQILFILAISVGLPYFVLSSTGPLIQAWFARSFPGRIPYRLYALSNLGSLLALVSYPFYFEWAFAVPSQAILWSAGFVVYALLCGYAAWNLAKTGDAIAPPRSRVSPKRGSESRRDSATDSPRWYQRLLWLLWPAFASIVLLAATNHVSTDIAAMPFMWIAPLALYLVTFIIAFDRPIWYRRGLVAAVMLVAIYLTGALKKLGVGWTGVDEVGTPGLIYSMFIEAGSEPAQFYISTGQFLIVNFAAMFAICLLCHGELFRQRPDPRYLTAYYLNIAAGGALGGIFVTLAAPRIFSTYFEWQLSHFAACLIAIGFLLRALVDFAFGEGDEPARRPKQYLLLGALVLAVFMPSSVLLLDLTEFLQPPVLGAPLRVRNFFGTLAVLERNQDNPLNRELFLRHGATTHGSQFTHPSRRSEPTTYYGRSSGIARAIDYYRRELQPRRMKLGVVGLGTGTLAAYADGGDSISFYEINPAVIDITTSGDWFTYLADCRQRGAAWDIRLGDARLTLRRELESNPAPRDGLGSPAGEGYHVIVLDAFSSDAIPVHLLTVEAFELYVAHLATPHDPTPGEPASAAGQHGAVAVHISNRYLNLDPVVRGIAEHYGLRTVFIESDDDQRRGIYSADWMIVTRNKALTDELAHFATPYSEAAPLLWTDDYSSLFEVLQ